MQYVVRLSATWQVRQFLLFRDLDEPDLWLATDGSGRWGEMNGAHRPELDGCYDIDLACTPFTKSLPIRRLPLHVGDSADLPVVTVDVETLDVRAATHRYVRLDTHRWQFERRRSLRRVRRRPARSRHRLPADVPPDQLIRERRKAPKSSPIVGSSRAMSTTALSQPSGLPVS